MAKNNPIADQDLQELVAENDTGGRVPSSRIVRRLIVYVAVLWSVFQIYYASRLPFELQSFLNEIGLGYLNVVVDDTRARSIHLAFALFLAFLSYPAFRNSPRHHVPWQDWLFAGLGVFTALYYILFYHELVQRVGAPNMQDVLVGCLGILILLEATRRSIGIPLMVIAIIFLLYNYFGQFLPISWSISHNSGSLNQIINQQWITTEGVFGVALGVSAKYVFLFVLFGALLDKAGAGNYFIKTAFAYLGHLRGGPAKAAVVASGLTGLISGSSIANVVTTGTFTIPMMKKVGFSSEKAGAVEVASSVNGQIMPPVMGAAAFLMIEYINMPYSQLIKHAFLPAIISYIALVYIVHLEACKQGMQGLPRTDPKKSLAGKLLSALTVFFLLCFIYFVVWLVSFLEHIVPSEALFSALIMLLLLVAYLGLLFRVSRFPDLELDSDKPIVELPSARPTVNAGLHYLLPVAVLIWCLMIKQYSPGLSAYYGTLVLIFIQLTQRPLMAFFRKQKVSIESFKIGVRELFDGLELGARNMIGIAIATSTAGIIVGVVALTGLGAQLADIIEVLSMGNLVLMLVMVAIFSLILGMGLPTTANYIVVSSLMAVVIVEVGRQNGLIVPLIAVHLFVFYFGIMADVTPPVGLASFAAAAISGGDPIKTGLVAFTYSLRTALLPFIFIFNTDLLLLNVTFWQGVVIFIVSTVAILTFTAGTMGWFMLKNKWWESLLLLLVTAILFRPGFFTNLVSPNSYEVRPDQLQVAMMDAPVGSDVEFFVSGFNPYGRPITFYAHVPMAEGATSEERLQNMGLTVINTGETIEAKGKKYPQFLIDDVAFDSEAARAGLDWDQNILSVRFVREGALSRYWAYPFGLMLLALLVVLQLRRKRGMNVS